MSIVVARPRQEVFEYLADVANHAEFNDHFLVDWRLTREDSYGLGAGVRFRVKAPLNRFGWADMTIVEVAPPHRIVEAGRSGKYNRQKALTVWSLREAHGGGTEVELTSEIEPALPTDRLMESFGARGWYRRKLTRSLKRLRQILEDGEGRGQRATIAGGPRAVTIAPRSTL